MSSESVLDLYRKEIKFEKEFSTSHVLSGACKDIEDYRTHIARIRALDDALDILINSIKTVNTERTDD